MSFAILLVLAALVQSPGSSYALALPPESPSNIAPEVSEDPQTAREDERKAREDERKEREDEPYDEGTSALESQIRNGIPNTALQSEFATTELKFTSSKTYPGTGNPGLSTSIGDSVEARLGQVVGFFVHSSFADNGSIAVQVEAGKSYYIQQWTQPWLSYAKSFFQPVSEAQARAIISQSVLVGG